MARPYAGEMSKLAETLAWANEIDIGPLRQAIRTAAASPLRAVGSGGSLTAAHALAEFHQRFTGRIAAVATPLEVIDQPLEPGVATWLLSAGGSNVDIVAAAESMAFREPRQVAVLCGKADSPLADVSRAHDFIDLLVYPPPTGKDGFLATNSLLGFCTLLARAYIGECGQQGEWSEVMSTLHGIVQGRSVSVQQWETSTSALWSRPTTLVLHGPTTRIGAIDLESKFTEAALGNLQVADFRNFAHGRHHWLAKRGESSAVLGLISDPDAILAQRTLDLIPKDIPQSRIYLTGTPVAVSLGSLLAAFRVVGAAGTARGIDPGRPGVPEFGRKLYNLPLPGRKLPRASTPLSGRDAAAIVRKVGVPIHRISASGELIRWREALTTFRTRLLDATFAGIVLDYDGTIVDNRHRFRPPEEPICAELVAALKTGVWVAVATGRGTSARRDLRATLPRRLWDRVVMGYYNGAEIGTLADDATPRSDQGPSEELRAVAAALRADAELARSATQTDRQHQITLEANGVMAENRLWDLANQVMLARGEANLTLTRSSHSVDIVRVGVSKLNVVRFLRKDVGAAPLLAIGDRGRWPGNDFELLGEPFALSVDETGVDPHTCWNLGSPGQRGPAVTLEYLSSLQKSNGGLRFGAGACQ